MKNSPYLCYINLKQCIMNRFEKIALVSVLVIALVSVSVLIYRAIAFDSKEVIKGEDMVDNGSIKRLSFDNHEYIMVYQSKGIAVVHNEACKCKK